MKVLPNIAILFLLLFLSILGKDILNCFEKTSEKQSSSLQKESNSDDYPDDESNDSEEDEDEDEDYDQLVFSYGSNEITYNKKTNIFHNPFNVQVFELNSLFSPPEFI